MRFAFLAILMLTGCATHLLPVPGRQQQYNAPREITPPPMPTNVFQHFTVIGPPLNRFVAWTNALPGLNYQIWFSETVIGPWALIATNTIWTGTNYLWGPLYPGFFDIESVNPTVPWLTSRYPKSSP